ncbi:NUDIX hydrolase [Candidatus Woesebacteria bacterium]|nr:NUDIX hydrolase [Candidatus Woesebacteria bacterium]
MEENKLRYKNRPVTANAVVIKGGEILLIQRRKEPFKDCWAIPGGFVETTETTKDACLRELEEETGVSGKIIRLIGVYDAPGRDPRHTVCVSYLVKVVGEIDIKADDDARDVKWFPLNKLPRLAFDHKEQLKDAIKFLNK